MGFFETLKNGLKKTKASFTQKLQSIVNSFTKIDEDLFDELEELFYTSDIGVSTTEYILDELRAKVKEKGLKDSSVIIDELKEIMVNVLGDDQTLALKTKPSVVFVIGVNGVGKTTSIGKIIHLLKKDGKNVIVAAADTFRAAAIEQLQEWCNKSQIDLIHQQLGSDPAAVVFDAISAVKKRNADVLVIDTAGRLNNKKNLMDELSKMNRVINRELPDSSIETLLVLDSTTGQNAIIQAKDFCDVANITGIVLTKLDGSSRGGSILSIKKELGVSVKYIGVGEKLDDLKPFHAREFVDALLEKDN